MKSKKLENRFNLGHLGNMNYLGNTIIVLRRDIRLARGQQLVSLTNFVNRRWT